MEANKTYLPFRALVGVMSAYHVALGIVISGPPEPILALAGALLGATGTLEPATLFVARMLGAYMLVFGLGMGLAAWDPIKNRALLSLGAILTVFRAVERLLLAEDLELALNVAPGRNWATIAILAGFAVALGLFRWVLYRDMRLQRA